MEYKNKEKDIKKLGVDPETIDVAKGAKANDDSDSDEEEAKKKTERVTLVE